MQIWSQSLILSVTPFRHFRSWFPYSVTGNSSSTRLNHRFPKSEMTNISCLECVGHQRVKICTSTWNSSVNWTERTRAQGNKEGFNWVTLGGRREVDLGRWRETAMWREEKGIAGERNSMHRSQGKENVKAAEWRTLKIWLERWFGKLLEFERQDETVKFTLE